MVLNPRLLRRHGAEIVGTAGRMAGGKGFELDAAALHRNLEGNGWRQSLLRKRRNRVAAWLIQGTSTPQTSETDFNAQGGDDEKCSDGCKPDSVLHKRSPSRKSVEK